MRRRIRARSAAAMLATGLAVGGGSAAAVQDSDLRDVFTAPIGIERAEPVAEIPFRMRYGKIFLDAEIDGQPREFIFDTGSPSMVSLELAQALDLEILGRNVGVDANGNEVAMDVARVDEIRLGDLVFRDVPVLVFDFSQLGTGACVIDGGVLGSEILPGSAWRFDAEAGVLSVAQDAEALAEADPVLETELFDFGYPHAPIVAYSVGDVSDRAMFDTGSASALALFGRVADNPSVSALIERETVRQGRGFEGESAGGLGTVRPLAQFTLGAFHIGDTAMGPQPAHLRAVPPTLLGAGLLDRYAVTLDYAGGAFRLETRNTVAEPVAPRGYTIAFDAAGALVSQLYDGSGAAAAGVRLEDRVRALNGRVLDVPAGADRCETVRWVMETLATPATERLRIERDGELLEIEIPAP